MAEQFPFKPMIYNAWSDFIQGKSFNLENVRKLISDSWKRCYEYGVDPLKGKGVCIGKKQLKKLD